MDKVTVFIALTGEVRAYVNYPWCVVGERRGHECVFSTREQCLADGSRGFGLCTLNPFYRGSVGRDVRVRAHHVRHK